MAESSISRLFPEDINLNDLFEILSPQNNLVLADDMMLSDANGTILQVSETYEKVDVLRKQPGDTGFCHKTPRGQVCL